MIVLPLTLPAPSFPPVPELRQSVAPEPEGNGFASLLIAYGQAGEVVTNLRAVSSFLERGVLNESQILDGNARACIKPDPKLTPDDEPREVRPIGMVIREGAGLFAADDAHTVQVPEAVPEPGKGPFHSPAPASDPPVAIFGATATLFRSAASESRAIPDQTGSGTSSRYIQPPKGAVAPVSLSLHLVGNQASILAQADADSALVLSLLRKHLADNGVELKELHLNGSDVRSSLSVTGGNDGHSRR
jgi:hypothetical protein